MLHSRCRPALAAAFFGAVLAAAPAEAQDQSQSPYEQCLSKAKGAAPTLACAKAELTRQEARLKAAEAKLAPTLPAPAKPLFKAANQAWTKFRDAQCAWDRANTAKGESADFAEIDCKVAITEARASELEGRAAPPDDEPEQK